ncbi:hypothetical protein [Paenibacillus sp. HJGM_3]|uniref:hypothetical protein n=1 Tax=Paenibacillus sp. HJGM_3 TaxID=3379816 RepID=UPI00385E702E
MSWNDKFSELAKQLVEHKPAICPTEQPDGRIDLEIAELRTDGFAGERLAYALAVKAGLHLLNESLDRSHTLSQDIHTSTGSYWHGIMHRMEGDYGNAKYWFRMVGSHPVYPELFEQAGGYMRSETEMVASSTLKKLLDRLLAGNGWDPYLFVDLVEQCVTSPRDEAAERLLKHVQWLEMRLLLQYSYSRSGGGDELLTN